MCLLQEQAGIEDELQGELDDIEAQIKALDAQLGSQSPGEPFPTYSYATTSVLCLHYIKYVALDTS